MSQLHIGTWLREGRACLTDDETHKTQEFRAALRITTLRAQARARWKGRVAEARPSAEKDAAAGRLAQWVVGPADRDDWSAEPRSDHAA